MKLYLLISILVIIFLSRMKAQMDTVRYDQNTGNYTIQYYDEDGNYINQTYIPWNKINPSIKCNIISTKYSNNFSYEWIIRSEYDSEQNINYFLIETKDSNFIDLSTCGWRNNRLRKIDGIGYSNKFKWSGDQGLEPGWEVGGFILESPGIPSIGISYFEGSGGSILSFSNSPPPEKILKEIDKIDGFPEGYVKRKTIVPRKIPSSLFHNQFLDTLISYTNKAYDFRWIFSNPNKLKYITLFDQTGLDLAQQDTLSAIINLEKVLNEVEQDSSTTLSSEAYALLKYNTEYLLRQLPKFEISKLFETLEKRIVNCNELGYVANRGVYNSLKKKIVKARKNFEKNKIKTALNILNAFSNQLNAQKEKAISGDCYQNIKGLLEYLIKELKKKS